MPVPVAVPVPLDAAGDPPPPPLQMQYSLPTTRFVHPELILGFMLRNIEVVRLFSLAIVLQVSSIFAVWRVMQCKPPPGPETHCQLV